MIEITLDVNWLSVAIAAIASMALGFFWYSKSFLGKPWMKDMGYNEKTLKKAQQGMGPMYGLTFLGSVATAFVLYNLLNSGLDMYVGVFFVWLGFSLPVQLTGVIFNKEQLWTAFWVNTSYQLASLLIMSIVISFLG